MKIVFLMGLVLFCFIGCQTGQPKGKSSQSEEISALTSVARGLTYKPITESELKNLGFQAAHDPQTRSALRLINTALSAQHSVKYCPENGERFSADMIYCPDGKVKLKRVE